MPSTGSPSRAPVHPKVLVLHSSHRGFPVSDGVSDGVIDAARRRGSGASNVYVEYLDLVRYNTAEDQRRTAELLRWKMRDVPVKAIVAGGRETMDFLAGAGRDIAPGVPVVMAATSGLSNALVRHEVTVVPLRVDFRAMLRTVAAALPDCKHILVISGANVSDRPARADFVAASREWADRFDFEYTDTLTHAAMMARVARPTPDTAIVFIGYFGDATGRPFVSAEVISAIAPIAGAPVFVSLEGHFRPGVLGGPLLPFTAYGKEIGRLTMDLAAGLPAIPEPLESAQRLLVPTFNWSEVKRWRVDPDALPEKSVFIGRPPTLWKLYRNEMIAAGTAFAILSVLVVALFLQSRHRRRAEQVAVASEERVRVLIEAAPEAIVSFDADTGQIVDANPRSLLLFGAPREELACGSLERFLVAGAINGMHVPATVAAHVAEALAGGEPAFECLVAPAHERVVIPCEVRLARLPHPERRLVRATLTNIAERKAIDSALYLLAGRSGSDEERRAFMADTLRELCAVIEVDVALIASLDEPGEAHTWVRWADGQASTGGRFAVGGTVCERVASERAIHLVQTGARLESPAGMMPPGAPAECAAAASLWNSENRCIGFLVVAGREAMRHPVRTRAVLQIVAGRAAQELEGMRRDRDVIEHQANLEAQVAMRTADLALANRNLEQLSEFGRQVTGSLDQQVILATLRAGLARLMPAEGSRILLLGDRADDHDAGDEHERALWTSIARPGVTTLSRTDDDPPWAHAPAGARSAMSAPLNSQQGPIGVLVVYSSVPADARPAQHAMLETLALHVASAMTNSRAYAQLRLAQEQLVEREKMAALGNLVAGVAHELNTPLGNALLLTSTLNDRTRALAVESTTAEHAASALGELRQVVRQAGEMLERSLRTATALMSSFKQVAVDQTVDRRPEGRIAIVAGVRGNDVTIEFKDDGHGISAANLRRVFEPFFTTRFGQGGSGLGLSISYNIVTSVLGGSIHATSPPGVGALFRLVLPLTAPLRELQEPLASGA